MSRRKLLVSIPCASGIDPYLFQWTIDHALHAPGHDVRLSLCHDRPVVQTRNRVCMAALKELSHPDDLLLSIDSDQIPYIDAKARTDGLPLLLEAAARPEVDVVNAITVRMTEKGPMPVLSRMTGPLEAEPHLDILFRPLGLHELSPNGVIGGAGIMVKRRVLQRFWDEKVPWFRDVFCWEQGRKDDGGNDLFGQRVLGHDIWFAAKANGLGFRTWVDTRVFWGHRKQEDIRQEYLREMDNLREIGKLKDRLRLAERELSLLKDGVPA